MPHELREQKVCMYGTRLVSNDTKGNLKKTDTFLAVMVTGTYQYSMLTKQEPESLFGTSAP